MKKSHTTTLSANMKKLSSWLQVFLLITFLTIAAQGFSQVLEPVKWKYESKLLSENEAELIFTALAELSTRQIAETDDATGMDENKQAASKGGNIDKQARQALESKTGKDVVSGENFLPPGKIVKKIEE
jgi:hypothetical protein